MNRPAGDTDDASVQPSPDGGVDATGGDGEPTRPTVVDLPEAPPTPVLAGIVPVPLVGDDGSADLIRDTSAHLDVIAAGSRGVTLERRWDELFTSSSEPDEAAWEVLDNAGDIYAAAGRKLLVSLALVDRTLDARPSGLTVGWNTARMFVAVEVLINETLSMFGDELVLLGIGREVDRWLGTADEAQRAGFVTLARHALDYARFHPNLPDAAKVGIGASWQGLLEPSDDLSQLVDASDVVMVSYYPLEANFSVSPAASAAADLDDLLAALGADERAVKVVLQEVGYPSAESVNSSWEQQDQFFQELFQTLQSRRDNFAFVNVFGLYDQPPAACEADAEALGAADSEAAAAAWCSMGLRTLDGTTKDAWRSVADGLATFLSP